MSWKGKLETPCSFVGMSDEILTAAAADPSRKKNVRAALNECGACLTQDEYV